MRNLRFKLFKGSDLAIYHCSVKPIRRKDGRSAVAAAAYRAGIELVDQVSGVVHNYTRKRGVLSSEIIAPHGARIDDPSALWNAAEAAEKRKDARTAREIVIALPEELTAGQRRELATQYAQEIADQYGVAVAVDLHAPDKEGDNRNWHAHLLMTTRKVYLTANSGVAMGDKSVLEWSDTKRHKNGFGRARDAVESLRRRWAELQNAALERVYSAVRVDHRSHRRRELETLPQKHMGPAANDMERKGKLTEKGDENRAIAEYNAAVAEMVEIREERDRQLAFKAKFAAAAAVPQPDLEPVADLFAVQAAVERADFEAAALAQANALAAEQASQEAKQAWLKAMAMMQAEQDRISAQAAFEDKVRAQLFADRERVRLAVEAKAKREAESAKAAAEQAAVKAGFEAKVAVERGRRINDLERISKRHMTAELTVGMIGLRAIKAAGGDPSNVDWAKLEKEMVASLRESGYENKDIARAILEHSPARPAITAEEVEAKQEQVGNLKGSDDLHSFKPR